MNKEVKADDVIFNFFKQICDEKNDKKCVDLEIVGLKQWKLNLNNMEANLDEADKIKHKANIDNNKQHLNGLKGKTASEWREYATQCMVEILDNKTNK